ncbi:MAG: ABC transporter substrate-binding protein, partial [Candidatus Deferrimicrobiaceae bacterium]
MRRLVLFLPGPFLALLALLLFPSPAPAGSPMVDPIRIGVLAPLSGPFASGGSAFLEAVTLAA